LRIKEQLTHLTLQEHDDDDDDDYNTKFEKFRNKYAGSSTTILFSTKECTKFIVI